MRLFALRAARAASVAILPLAIAGPASAATVSITGSVINLCVLTVATPGVLAIDQTGMGLSSEALGGIAASLTVVATGTAPTITFTAPGLAGPSSGGATSEIAYASVGGANRAYAGTGYVYVMNRLLDTITINGRATNPNGFASGFYTLSTTATCAQ